MTYVGRIMVKIASTNLNDAELMTPNFFFFQYVQWFGNMDFVGVKGCVAMVLYSLCALSMPADTSDDIT